MAYDSTRGVTVLFGGVVSGGTQSNETWEWDGTNWAQKFPATSPSGRELTSMAYDSARHIIVLFGGAAGASNVITFDDTWEWDGFNWTRRNPSLSPSSRAGSAMAYDSTRGVTVLFGGIFISASGDLALLGDSWEWDGTAWTQKFSVAAPPEGGVQGTCFDSIRGVTVLFGGLTDVVAEASDDTFEWDGSNWETKFPSTVPPPRAIQAMAYDSVREVSVVFGGVDINFSPIGDTWEWDGIIWRERTPAAPPSARGGAAAAFDSKRGVTVLFGGSDNTNTLLNETWEWTGPGPTITQQPVSQSVVLGQSATFTVVGGGALPLTFHWRKNGVELTDGGGISGATTSTFTIDPTNGTSAGSYDVEVTNTCGTILSNSVTLDTCKVNGSVGDCDGNGILDSCEIAANAALDANGNGVLDSCETGGGSPTPPTGQTACGVCGGGTAATMPLALLALCVWPRRRWPS